MTLTANKNLLRKPNFQVVCDRLPNICRFVSTATLPSLTAAFVSVPTPFGNIKQHSDKATFSDLELSVSIDEDLESYIEALEWMTSYLKPQDFNQYKNEKVILQSLNATKFTDLTVYTQTNKGNKNIGFVYHNIHPIDLSTPSLSQQHSASVPLQFTISLAYDYFTITKT